MEIPLAPALAGRLQGHGRGLFRNNTVAFSWDAVRFGQGGASGRLLELQSYVRAIVENNIFEFADNDAVTIASQAKDVELVNNTFSHNLWSGVKRTVDSIAIDEKTWAQLSELGFGKVAGNQWVSAALPLDQAWFDVYLSRTAMTPGKVEMDDWNQLREMLGQPLIAKGGQAGTGFAPMYDWKKALTLFPKNPKVKAGARARDLPVQFR